MVYEFDLEADSKFQELRELLKNKDIKTVITIKDFGIHICTRTIRKKNDAVYIETDYPEALAPLWIMFRDRQITKTFSESLLKTFPDANWLIFEINKASTWEQANPNRRKSNFARFINNWLARAWDKRRTVSYSTNQSSLDAYLNRSR